MDYWPLVKDMSVSFWDPWRWGVVPRMSRRGRNDLNNTPLIWDTGCPLLNYYLGRSWFCWFNLRFTCFSFSFTKVTRIPFLWGNWSWIFNILKTLVSPFSFTVNLTIGYRWWSCGLKGDSRVSRSDGSGSYWWLRLSFPSDFIDKRIVQGSPVP